MKQFLDDNLNLILKVGVAAAFVSTLFTFAKLTTDTFDTPKFVVLLILVLAMLVLLTARFAISGKVSFLRTPLDLPLLLLVAVAAVSTILSSSPYVSLLGNQVRVHGSLVTLIVYVLFYFLAGQAIKSLKDIRWISSLAILGATVLALWGLANYFGIRLNFLPSGSSFSTAGVLAIFLPALLTQVFTSRNLVTKGLLAGLITLFGLFIMLAGTWPVWVSALIGVGAVFLILRPSLLKFNLLFVAVPAVILVFMLILSLTPPVGEDAQNFLHDKFKNYPRELQLSLRDSWKISVSAFRDSPFWGSGPATYLFDFTQHKPLEYNQGKLWTLRFDNAFNEYLQVLATLGGVGLFALLAATAIFASSFYQRFIVKRWQDSSLQLSLGLGALVFFVLLLLHSSSMVLWVVGLLTLAGFFAVHGDEERTLPGLLQNVLPMQGGRTTIHIDALPSILLVLSSLLTLAVLFFGGKFVLADYHHRKALDAVSQNQGLEAYNRLVKAEQLNPFSDLYRIDIAQVNFALANAIASSKGPTADNPQGSFTEEDKQNIQVLLQQSIAEARTAVTLSPKSVINWEVLAQLYRQIAGVAQNALVFSLDSYGRAIMVDPLNPVLRLNVGGTYYAIQSYDLAIRFFTDSINLKPDYANGYYNLSVALRDKGDLQGALAVAQRVVELVEPDSADFKVATDYLNDLKTKTGQPTEPPAATTSGALQNQSLPKVVNVGNPPEKIATPEAVKKPSPTPKP